MKKCKNCHINDARYICLGCSREFCTYCMKEDEIICFQCRYNNNKQQENKNKNKNKNQTQQQEEETEKEENKFNFKKYNRRIVTIINIVIVSSILHLGIILVLTSYPSLMNLIFSNDIISNEEEEYYNNRDGFIYIFPFPFAIPIEFNASFIFIPLILIFIIIIPIIFFIFILKSVKIF